MAPTIPAAATTEPVAMPTIVPVESEDDEDDEEPLSSPSEAGDPSVQINM
jgi:hypothetical protein